MKKVLFLHLPKTAGQSVHQFLIDTYGRDSVCPARVNDQLKDYSTEDLERFTVYSGHLDWSRFDEVAGEFFTFTILRDPLDRLLSFYFYLREQAKIFEKRGELDSKPGLKATLKQTPFEYFVDSKNVHRGFIDENYDNFYTYFFAGRRFSARGELNKMVGNGKVFASPVGLVDLAGLNLLNSVDAVYSISDWRQKLASDLGIEVDQTTKEYALNAGKTSSRDRKQLLIDLGASHAVFDRLDDMCKLDYKLLNTLDNDC